jgi:hypothetical protein
LAGSIGLFLPYNQLDHFHQFYVLLVSRLTSYYLKLILYSNHQHTIILTNMCPLLRIGNSWIPTKAPLSLTMITHTICMSSLLDNGYWSTSSSHRAEWAKLKPLADKERQMCLIIFYLYSDCNWLTWWYLRNGIILQ